MIDREIKSKDLAARVGISPTTLAKMKKDGAKILNFILHITTRQKHIASADFVAKYER
jgi:hypothetical protein